MQKQEKQITQADLSHNFRGCERIKKKRKKTKTNKGEIIRSTLLESSTFLVSFPGGISHQKVSLQLISS